MRLTSPPALLSVIPASSSQIVFYFSLHIEHRKSFIFTCRVQARFLFPLRILKPLSHFKGLSGIIEDALSENKRLGAFLSIYCYLKEIYPDVGFTEQILTACITPTIDARAQLSTIVIPYKSGFELGSSPSKLHSTSTEFYH